MDNDQFIIDCVHLLAVYGKQPKEGSLEAKDIYVVWSCKTLQNNKALLSTTIEDGMYYEITYNGDKREFYIDSYVKESNQLVKRR